MVDLNLTIRVPALEKLVDYVASGVGSVGGTMLLLWKSDRAAQAKRIAAQGEADAVGILATGQAGALAPTSTAQEEARALWTAPEGSVQAHLAIADGIEQRIRFQEEKRQRNIASVVSQAALALGDGEAPQHEPNHDWTARFFDEVQDISSEGMQALWASVLAGEVERPGSTSIHTLDVLRNLDQRAAQLFETLCSLSVALRIDPGEILVAHVASLGRDAGDNALKAYGLDFGHLNILNEHGLIISDYNSWRDFRVSVVPGIPENKGLVLPFAFQGHYWVLIPKEPRPNPSELRIFGVALTRAGRELSRVVRPSKTSAYAEALAKFFSGKGLQMMKVDSWQPQSVSHS